MQFDGGLAGGEHDGLPSLINPGAGGLRGDKGRIRDRDIGSVVDEAQVKIAQQVTLPAGYWLAWGGQFEN